MILEGHMVWSEPLATEFMEIFSIAGLKNGMIKVHLLRVEDVLLVGWTLFLRGINDWEMETLTTLTSRLD